MMGIKLLRLRHKYAPATEGCRWCGIERRLHGKQWVPIRTVSRHSYVEPTPKQIAARIRAHNNERLLGPSVINLADVFSS